MTNFRLLPRESLTGDQVIAQLIGLALDKGMDTKAAVADALSK
jgi:hypothetical protein